MSQPLILVIPAHNEEAGILDTLDSIKQQTLKPDRVIVLCDNCTDNTAELARAAGAEVWHTRDNRGKKGGALNQAWERLRITSGYFATMDADTVLAPDFFANALAHFARAASDGVAVGGISATFAIKRLHTTLSLAQELEYARFCRVVGRKKGRPHCLAGAAVVYNAAALHEIASGRDYLYAPVLVEDYELTLALRHSGYAIFSPKNCRAVTEVMPTLSALYKQRIRWYMGTLQELRKYGLSSVTWRDFGNQSFTVLTMLFRWLFVTTLVASYCVVGALALPWWAPLPLVVFSCSRAVEASRLGWKYSLLAALMFEELYLVLLELIFLVGGVRIMLGRDEADWGHVTLAEARVNQTGSAMLSEAA